LTTTKWHALCVVQTKEKEKRNFLCVSALTSSRHAKVATPLKCTYCHIMNETASRRSQTFRAQRSIQWQSIHCFLFSHPPQWMGGCEEKSESSEWTTTWTHITRTRLQHKDSTDYWPSPTNVSHTSRCANASMNSLMIGPYLKGKSNKGTY
jgi:hypothetical protein